MHALVAQDHGLAVPGLMIDEAADDQLRQQRAARHDFRQRQIDRQRLADLLTGPAGNTETNMSQNSEAGPVRPRPRRSPSRAPATIRAGMLLCRLARDMRRDRRRNAGPALPLPARHHWPVRERRPRRTSSAAARCPSSRSCGQTRRAAAELGDSRAFRASGYGL